jgi:hypothetical protein
MPLLDGSSREIIQHNIREMIDAGHPPDQAEAAAYSHAGKGPKKDEKGKKEEPDEEKLDGRMNEDWDGVDRGGFAKEVIPGGMLALQSIAKSQRLQRR